MSTQLSHALERIKLLEVGHEKLEAHIKEVRMEAYNFALEQAAKVCEQPSDEIQVTDELSKYTYKDCFDCAAAIRAMKKECGK